MNPLKKLLKPLLSRPYVAARACRSLLRLDQLLQDWLNELLVYAGEGEHPKHRLMNYADFFVQHVGPDDRVLDVGCGRGFVAARVAEKAREVVGIDLNRKNILLARARFVRDNLRFVEGDALKPLPGDHYDAVVLSNVLEHIEDRVPFLKELRKLSARLLVRVPLITRDWIPLLKREWGMDYRSDSTHFVEYTEDLFRAETSPAGWTVESLDIRFGEIWAVLRSGTAGEKE